ncbi:hypothetical protein Clacol_006170 [Clathrus columnatus]|uniref:DNA repair protein REV1 n=1 Tax=Clathrus columnatus TaxID=1419009 RepID=A0AAV5ADZ1_9AGAM|nr:hypothetical protein Clacol_006170 [Clathrus columnatus]
MANHEHLHLTTSSSDLFGKEDSDFLEALRHVRTPPDSQNTPTHQATKHENVSPSTTPRKEKESITAQSSFSYLIGPDDPEYLESLIKMSLPEPSSDTTHPVRLETATAVPTQSNSISKRKRPQSPEHDIGLDNDDIYGPSRFHGWGEYMSRKRAKLSIQNNEILENNEEIKSNLFKGLALHVNGRTSPSVQELRKLIVQHGGVFHPYLDRKKMVTHIIASNLTPAKVLEFKHMKVVRPEWVLESISAGVLLPWQNFILETTSQSRSSQSTTKPSQPISQGEPVSKDTLVSKPLSEVLKEKELNRESDIVAAPSPKVADRPLHGTDPAKVEEASRIPSYAFHTSNPVAARKMDDPEWRAEHTAIAPGFLEGYYRNSRLHHLSTWKAELQELVAKAAETLEIQEGEVTNISEGTSMTGITFRKPPSVRKGKNVVIEQPTIMHCDFDSFFVAAGLIDRPHLRGNRLLFVTLNLVKAFGIKGGMSLGQARRLCPDIQTIPYEFEVLSLQFYIILMSYADDIEAVSVDEALIDVSSTVEQAKKTNITDLNRQQPDFAKELAETIRKRVRETTGCEISIGIAHNILLARVATRLAKPAGSHHILPENGPQTLAPLDVEDIRGFGWSARSKLQAKFGPTTLGELGKQSKAALCSVLGKKNGEKLWNAIRGIDDTKLESDRVRKSVSCEINYGIRFANQEEAEVFIQNVSKEVSERLKKINKYGRSLTLKIMVREPNAPVEAPKFLGHGICETVNKSTIIEGPGGKATADENIIGEHSVRLLRAMHLDPKELRGVGIHVQKLEEESAAGSSGQTLLPFKRAETPTTFTNPPVAMGPPQHEAFSLPSFSQLDASVMAALPDSIRKEIEQEYSRHNIQQPIAGPSRHHDIPDFPEIESPTKKGYGAELNVSHITKRLAPKSRPSAIATKQMHPLFAKRVDNNQGVKGPKVSTQELKLFEVDPAVWRELPVDIQREQWATLRAANVGTGMALRASMSAEAKQARLLHRWRKRKRPLMSVRGRRQEIFANHAVVPSLKRRGKTKQEDLKITEGDDVQGTLTQWVENFEEDGPRQGDVDHFGKFLAKCVESDIGSERAVSALKWWKFLLQRRWPNDEHEQSEETSNLELGVGGLWWKALWAVKRRIDVIVKKRFGGQLSLK